MGFPMGFPMMFLFSYGLSYVDLLEGVHDSGDINGIWLGDHGIEGRSKGDPKVGDSRLAESECPADGKMMG